MHQVIDENMREQLLELDPRAGDIVSVKYSGGAHAITVVGQFGKSINAPYVVQSDGRQFNLRPSAVFTQSEYAFTSIDIALSMQREEFLDEVERGGVKLPFPVTTRIHEEDEGKASDPAQQIAAEESARLEQKAKSAMERSDDARGAIHDIRARMRQRREQ